MAPKSSKSKSKSKAKKRSGLKRRGTKYVRGGSGLVRATKTLGRPDRLIVKLPYYEQFTLSDAARPGSNFFWNLNSIWDPNRSGIGHNPSYFTAWSNIYNRYRVLGVKARVTFQQARDGGSDLNPNGCRVFMYAANDSVQTGDESQMEQSHMISGTIHPQGKPIQTLTKYFNCQRITGRTVQQYMADDRYQATMKTNPQEVITLTAGARSLTPGAVTLQAVYATIHLTYYVELFDPMISPLQDVEPENRAPASNLTESIHVPAGSVGPTDYIDVRRVDPVV